MHQVSSSSFNRSEVIVSTDKQTHKEILLKTSTSLRTATPVENERYERVFTVTPELSVSYLEHLSLGDTSCVGCD